MGNPNILIKKFYCCTGWIYISEPVTFVEVIAPCRVENKLQAFFPNKIFTHAPELSSTVRRVTTAVAGNITHTLRHPLLTPFFQPLLISPPLPTPGWIFLPLIFQLLPSRLPSSSQQSLMAAAGRQMRLNKVYPNTLLGGVLPEPWIAHFWKTHFSPRPDIAVEHLVPGSRDGGIILIAALPPILRWAIKQWIASSVIHKWAGLPSHDRSFILGASQALIEAPRLEMQNRGCLHWESVIHLLIILAFDWNLQVTNSSLIAGVHTIFPNKNTNSKLFAAYTYDCLNKLFMGSTQRVLARKRRRLCVASLRHDGWAFPPPHCPH